MTDQAEASAHIDPQLVGNSFVEQYYKVLHQYPEQLHRFYQDSSCLSRPGANGLMILVTTAKGINEQILSLDYQNYQTEILTVDAQGSYCSAVMVLVTGYLIEKDNEKRKFAQSFFLAPQENGFYVLNDVFRFVDDKQPLEMAIINDDDDEETNDDDDEETAPLSTCDPHSEPTDVPNDSMLNQATISSAEDTITNDGKDTLQNGKTLVPEKGSDVTDSPRASQNGLQAATETDSPGASQNGIQVTTGTDSPIKLQNGIQAATETDSPRVSQNGIQVTARTDSPRKLQNGIQAAAETDSPRASQNGIQAATGTNSPRKLQNSPRKLENGIQATTETNSPRSSVQDDSSKKSFASIVNALKENASPFQLRVPPPISKRSRVTAASKASAPVSNNSLKENAAKSDSIFVANLPLDVTVEQVREIFVKFGPLKPNGVKVRTNQLRPNCFSFVEFESADSVLNALKASPVTFGDRKVFIEEKKGSGNDSVKRSVDGNQTDNLKARVSSNGRRHQGSSMGPAGVGSPKAHQNNEGVRVQSKVLQKEGGGVAHQGLVEMK